MRGDRIPERQGRDLKGAQGNALGIAGMDSHKG
jgi:hypothetical protein